MANPNMSGGDRVCAIYAQKLNALGHKVNIIAPKKRFLSIKHQIKRLLKGGEWVSKKKQAQNHFDLLGLAVTYCNDFAPVKSQDVIDADIVIATWWETIEWVCKFQKSKGVKVHFVQGYDLYNRVSISSRIECAWQYPMHKITIANWLVDIIRKDFLQESVSLVPNSVALEQFYANQRTKQVIPTVGFLFSEIELKGVRVALKVIQGLKERVPSLRVVAFGTRPPVDISVPDYVELNINPPQDEIRLLYQQCDLWLCCSLSEGFGLTILEAMACRVPAVSTKCGGPEDIVTDASNGYLCDVNDVECLTSAAHKVLSFSDEEWLAFSDKAYQHASEYTWDDAAKLFEEALQKIK